MATMKKVLHRVTFNLPNGTDDKVPLIEVEEPKKEIILEGFVDFGDHHGSEATTTKCENMAAHCCGTPKSIIAVAIVAVIVAIIVIIGVVSSSTSQAPVAVGVYNNQSFNSSITPAEETTATSAPVFGSTFHANTEADEALRDATTAMLAEASSATATAEELSVTNDAFKEILGYLQKTVNSSIEPCDDFYEHACGLFPQTATVPDEVMEWTGLDAIDRIALESLSTVLNNTLSQGSVLSHSRVQAKQYYQQCLLSGQQNILSDLFAHIVQVLPRAAATNATFFSQDDAPTSSEILEALSQGMYHGYSMGLFHTTISSSRTIRFAPHTFGMSSSSYTGPMTTAQRNYMLYLSDLIYEFGKIMPVGAISKTSAEEIAVQIFTFEKRLNSPRSVPAPETPDYAPEDEDDPFLLGGPAARIHNDPAASITPKTLGQFANRYTKALGMTDAFFVSNFRQAWDTSNLALLVETPSNESLYSGHSNPVRGEGAITANTLVEISDPTFFQSLVLEMTKMYSTNETLAKQTRQFFGNYFTVQLILSYVHHLPGKLSEIHRLYRASTEGYGSVTTGKPLPLWEQCVKWVADVFPEPVDQLYAEDGYGKEEASKVEQIETTIRAIFMSLVNASDMLTDASRVASLKEMAALRVFIGHDNMDHVDDAVSLESKYQSLNLTDSYLTNEILVKRWKTWKNITPNIAAWWMPESTQSSSYSASAYYAPWKNSLVIPAGLERPPMIGPGYPDVWIIATFGFVFSHEVSHEFSSADTDRRSPWDFLSKSRFRERTRLLQEQYSAYRLMGVALNGAKTSSEDVADNTGVKLAFQAYKKLTAHQSATIEQMIQTHLNYTQDQLFFLAHAQLFCGVYKKEHVAEIISVASHSASPFRIIGPLQNLPEFSEAFKCPVDSYMNPKTKNTIW
ncbi:putative Neprilysin [Hypsibius exemplaris]|uniref:Neprilysin n=1 Tax=Hypsibius exemplaris TaxID=2072580 RepID=A0A1W0WPM2_HYPEX|nr:putative Neprilysin [Hypsibius exemplaris]